MRDGAVIAKKSKRRAEPTSSRGAMPKRHAFDWAIPAAVALATVAAFLPVLRNGFVVWDDDRNFVENPHFRGLGLEQLRWMWTTFHMGHYVPLSWMTLGLDYDVWGMNPSGYHLTSLLLHAANAVVVYFLARWVLEQTAAPQWGQTPFEWSLTPFAPFALVAAIAALLFALHPLRVESVAWATERRDVLSGFFYFSSILAYLRSRGKDESKRGYWIAVLLFVCALLSKATSMSLPAVLLILNVYPMRRIGGAAAWTSRRLVCLPPRSRRCPSLRFIRRLNWVSARSSPSQRTASRSISGKPSL